MCALYAFHCSSTSTVAVGLPGGRGSGGGASGQGAARRASAAAEHGYVCAPPVSAVASAVRVLISHYYTLRGRQ